MTAEAAVLSFYLLFPLWNGGQEMLSYAAKGEFLGAGRKREELSRLEDFLSGRQRVDLAGWQIAADVPRLMDEIGLGAEELARINREGDLRLLEYGVERFAADARGGEGKTVVSVNDKQFTQTVYDGSYRVAEKTVWQNSQEAKGIRLLKRSTYSYSSPDAAALPDSLTEEFLDEQKVVQTSFNGEGRPSRVRTYVVRQGGRQLVQQESYSYDGGKRLASEESVTYSASGARQHTTRTAYTYTKNSASPDTKYYEDDVLRIETSYIGQDKYRTTTYFDNRYSITATFENGKRLSEVVYINGVKQRERIFND